MPTTATRLPCRRSSAPTPYSRAGACSAPASNPPLHARRARHERQPAPSPEHRPSLPVRTVPGPADRPDRNGDGRTRPAGPPRPVPGQPHAGDAAAIAAAAAGPAAEPLQPGRQRAAAAGHSPAVQRPGPGFSWAEGQCAVPAARQPAARQPQRCAGCAPQRLHGPGPGGGYAAGRLPRLPSGFPLSAFILQPGNARAVGALFTFERGRFVHPAA
ncbi:hypothetical protein G6F65_013079 [Rhizopus arrhizus]|nr:hypothetical protein G6F65_013079 [Rhizopus arrhizus]